MEIDDPTRLLRIQNPSEAEICARCSEPLSSKTQTDGCGRCKVRWEEERQRRRSVGMEALAFQKFVPTIAGAFVSGLATKKGESSSSTQIQRVSVVPRQERWPVSTPYPETRGVPLFDTRQPPPPVTNKTQANSYPEVHDRWFRVPTNSSSHRTNHQPPPHRSAMIVSHPTSKPLPSPSPTVVPHFNAKGELIHPVMPPAMRRPGMTPQHPPAPPMRLRREIRQCARPGCAVVLLPNEGPHICSKCHAALSQPRHDLFRIHPPAPSSHIHPSTHIAPGPVFGSDVIPPVIVPPPDTFDDPSDNLDDLELQYPEPEDGDSQTSQPLFIPTGHDKSGSIPRNVIPIPVEDVRHHSPSLVEPLPLFVKHPLPIRRATVPKLPTAPQQSSRNEPRPVPKSRPPQVKLGRKCTTPNCNGILPADSTASRCFPCVKKEWRSKLQAHADAGPPRPHKRRKTVTWSDSLEVDLGAGEDAATQENDSTGGSTQTPVKLKIRIPTFQSLRSSLEPSTLSGEISTIANSSSEASDCKTPTSSTSPSPHPTDDSSISTPRSGETPPTSIASTSPIFLHDKIDTISKSPSPLPRKSESPTSALQDPALSNSTNEDTPFQPISGWDSDLTDLTDLTDLEESGVDESSSSDEESTEERPSFKIRIPARPLPTPIPQDGTLCAIPRCRRSLPEGYRWKCCVQCRLHHREYQRKRLNIQVKDKRPNEEMDRDFKPLRDYPAKPPPDFLTPGARLCTIKNCTHIIPSPEEYPWKMCEPCRIRTRNDARRRRMKKTGEITYGDQPVVERVCSTNQADVGSGSESEDIPLAVLSGARKGSEGTLRRCKRQDCGLWINPQSQGTLCNQCKKRRSTLKVSPPTVVRPSRPETVIKRVPAPKKTIPPYTEYICWSALLDVFHKRIAGFLEAHRCYKRFKQSSQPAQAVKQATFKFEGEYSVVALDFEVVGKKPEVHRHTMRLKDEFGRAGDLLFLSTYWVTILEQEEGIATRFKCKLRSLRRAEMHGELEIAVLPDHSHVLFPGQRTIVRFCLVV